MKRHGARFKNKMSTTEGMEKKIRTRSCASREVEGRESTLRLIQLACLGISHGFDHVIYQW